MKTFVATLCAILVAAAVIFYCWLIYDWTQTRNRLVVQSQSATESSLRYDGSSEGKLRALREAQRTHIDCMEAIISHTQHKPFFLTASDKKIADYAKREIDSDAREKQERWDKYKAALIKDIADADSNGDRFIQRENRKWLIKALEERQVRSAQETELLQKAKRDLALIPNEMR